MPKTFNVMKWIHVSKSQPLIAKIFAAGVIVAMGIAVPIKGADASSPNVIVVMTDDQGYGDIGFHGNKVVSTPHLDTFAKQSVELSHFYVTPVCSTTRAGFLTGRYHYRTGVTNVGSCGDRLRANELTLAEVFQAAGYSTAIFGKWHLGDNYPMRPQDKGFQETVIHKACCLTPWFRPNGKNYFDPFLFHNGIKQQYTGYCMNVYTDLAMEFIEANKNQPFFIYLASNTPHTPLVVSNKYSDPYRDLGVNDRQAKYYGTITNIDDNFGRLMHKLQQLGLAENTLIVFLSDNGPVTSKADWPLELRGRKSMVYEGGIRVPCLIRLPGNPQGGSRVDQIASYVDLMPTILDATGVDPPKGVQFDGASLRPLLQDPRMNWPDRTLFIQWHQGIVPEKYRAFAVRTQRYKLVQSQGHEGGLFDQQKCKYELFDMLTDPCETNDLASMHPLLVTGMKRKYEIWYADVMKSHGGQIQEIVVGSPKENPTRLMASSSIVNQNVTPSIVTGQWPIKVIRNGRYDVKMVFHKGLPSAGTLHLNFGEQMLKHPVSAGLKEYVFEQVPLAVTTGMLEMFVTAKTRTLIPTYIDIALTTPN